VKRLKKRTGKTVNSSWVGGQSFQNPGPWGETLGTGGEGEAKKKKKAGNFLWGGKMKKSGGPRGLLGKRQKGGVGNEEIFSRFV